VQEAFEARAELAQALEQVARKMDAVERERAASHTQVEAALAASAEERGALAAGSRLLEERVQGITEALEALSGRIDEGRAENREIAGLRGVLDVLAGRIDDLGAGVEAVAARPGGVPAERHDELAQRVEAIAAAVESRAANKETDLVLGKVLLRLDAIEREQKSLADALTESATGNGSSEDAFAELRLLVENARMRIELLEHAAHPSGTHVEHVPAQVFPIRGSEG
jgi:chromosome segregation ATPase